jgi:hypothetical protein
MAQKHVSNIKPHQPLIVNILRSVNYILLLANSKRGLKLVMNWKPVTARRCSSVKQRHNIHIQNTHQ